MPDEAFADVLAAAKSGDDGAFTVLFRSVQPALLRYLRTVGGALADDVAADTWVSVVRGLHRFAGDEQGWRSWVFTIARARLRDEQRRTYRRPALADLDVLAEYGDGTDVFDEVQDVLSTEAALSLVARLPVDQAEAVLLRYVAGLDAAHAGRVLGKRPGTVRVNAHRGLKRLADLLGPRPDPSGNDLRVRSDQEVT